MMMISDRLAKCIETRDARLAKCNTPCDACDPHGKRLCDSNAAYVHVMVMPTRPHTRTQKVSAHMKYYCAACAAGFEGTFEVGSVRAL